MQYLLVIAAFLISSGFIDMKPILHIARKAIQARSRLTGKYV